MSGHGDKPFDGTISNDVREVLFKWHTDFSECFAGLREDANLAMDDNFYSKVIKLKDDFEKLSVEEQARSTEYDTSKLNSELTLGEVSEAIDSLPNGKSYLEIPGQK